MTDEEFVEELVTRINLFLDADRYRANQVLLAPLAHAGYANVGHFLGQLGIPRHLNPATASPEEMVSLKLISPVIEEGRIIKFEVMSGEELQKRAQDLENSISDFGGANE